MEIFAAPLGRLPPIPEGGATLRSAIRLRSASCATNRPPCYRCARHRPADTQPTGIPLMTGRTLSHLRLAGVLIALALLGCGDNEATQRKVLMKFLPSRITAKPGVHV